eukprot:UN12560
MTMDSSDSSEKRIVENKENVTDFLNVNNGDMQVMQQNEMVAQKTPDSVVMVSGGSVDPDYEIVDVDTANKQDSNSNKTPRSDDFVDVTTES